MSDVLMPQMGESIAEGTVVRWIKNVGDLVDRDEPLFEISTDKVDAEIPSPVAGVLTEIRAKEGETVPVNTVVAIIAPAGTETRPPGAAHRGAEGHTSDLRSEPPTSDATAAEPTKADRGRPAVGAPAERGRSSPLVRKIAEEHQVDISVVRGSGVGGRVTRDDILAFIGQKPVPAVPATSSPSASMGQVDTSSAATGAGLAGQTVRMSVVRHKIAERMTASQRTSAHAHSVFEVNFGRIEHIRLEKRADYERAGTKLTYLSFIVSAVAQALGAVPALNASVRGDDIIYHKAVHVGIAVALDWGLIVPVIRDANHKDLLGLSRTIADLAGRARSKQLKPEEVAGGTFTVTNPGALGALFGMPIINQPQVAILGVGSVERRPVVVGDAIAIRPTAHLTLGFDHRIIDGAVADTFMSHVKRALEDWDPSRA